jgi:hypothetical protein
VFAFHSDNDPDPVNLMPADASGSLAPMIPEALMRPGLAGHGFDGRR